MRRKRGRGGNVTRKTEGGEQQRKNDGERNEWEEKEREGNGDKGRKWENTRGGVTQRDGGEKRSERRRKRRRKNKGSVNKNRKKKSFSLSEEVKTVTGENEDGLMVLFARLLMFQLISPANSQLSCLYPEKRADLRSVSVWINCTLIKVGLQVIYSSFRFLINYTFER